MLQNNADRILETVSASDTVVDIGGWAQPFNRATHVVDIMPFATRGIFGSLGGKREYFSEQTWIVHDVCGTAPLPFDDKSVDFVICSHTLEDIRDPMHLCSEMIRVAKRGYVEVPSRAIESVRGLEGKHYAGYYHHRWLIEREGNRLTFRLKPHLLHNSSRYYLPNLYLRRLSDEQRVTWMFWENSFDYSEAIQLASLKVVQELEDFVLKQQVPPMWYWIDPIWLTAKYTIKRFRKRENPIEQQFWSSMPEVLSQ